MGFITKFLTIIIVIVGLFYKAELWPLVVLGVLFVVEPIVTKTAFFMHQRGLAHTKQQMLSLGSMAIWIAQLGLCIYSLTTFN